MSRPHNIAPSLEPRSGSKAFPMLDHVMLWVARIMTFLSLLLLCNMIFVLLPTTQPPYREAPWHTICRNLLFVGSILTLFSLFFFRFKILRLYLIVYSILFLLYPVFLATADQLSLYKVMQRSNALDFHYYLNNFMTEITQVDAPLLLLGPVAILWIAARLAQRSLPRSY